MAVDKRLMLSLVGVAAVIAGVGGWAMSRGAEGTSGDDVVMDTPGTVQTPTIGTNRPVQGDPLPTVDLVARGGGEVSTASLIGQPLVINTWFSACAPCLHEMPDLATVHRELGDTVRFVGVNTIDSESAMLRFASERGVAYELLRDPNGRFVSEIGIATFPTTLLVTADGTIVRQTGVLDAAKLRSLIDELLI